MKTIFRDPSCRHEFESEEVVQASIARQRALRRHAHEEKLKLDAILGNRMAMLNELGGLLRRAETVRKAKANGQTPLF